MGFPFPLEAAVLLFMEQREQVGLERDFQGAVVVAVISNSSR